MLILICNTKILFVLFVTKFMQKFIEISSYIFLDKKLYGREGLINKARFYLSFSFKLVVKASISLGMRFKPEPRN